MSPRRAYLASPYRSHVCYNLGRHVPIQDAMRTLLSIAHKFRPVWSVLDVRGCPVDCVWSPLIEGDIRRAEISHFEDELWTEPEALAWCRENLRTMGFNTLILATSIPRLPGYGDNGMDKEAEDARELGLTVLTDIDITME